MIFKFLLYMILSKFSESLTELLILHNITPSAFAKIIGCGKGTISRYQSGQKMPSLDLLVRMADHFQCSTDYLLGLETELYTRKFHTPPPFQQRLPEFCKALGITKYQIEHKAKIAQSAIYKWQNGTDVPSVESVVKIATTFGCSVDFVLGRSDF